MASGFDSSGWIHVGVGALVGVLSAVVVILVAWRQRVFQLRDRAADQLERDKLQEANAQVQGRLERRDLWRPEYDESRDLLKHGDAITYQVREHGPLGSQELQALGIEGFIMTAEQLADRGIDELKASRLDLASAARQLAAEVPELAMAAPTGGRSGPDPAVSRQMMRLAVRQDRAAREMSSALAAAWQALRLEWGG